MQTITDKQVKQFFIYLTDEEKSAATQEKYLRDVRYFRTWLDTRPLSKAEVLAYKAHLTKIYAPASVNAALSSLNSFFVFLARGDLKVKTVRLQKQIFAAAERELTKVEYARLLCAAKRKGKEKMYLLMQTICATGIRVSELSCITVESLRPKKAVIHLKGKTRVVFLPDALCQVLSRFAGKHGIRSGPIFVSASGRSLDRFTVWKQMKALCRDANVERDKVFPHNLRHLFARTFYSLQKDIVRLADILGHSSINTTRIYTMETGEIHRKQIQKLGLLRC